LLLLQLYLNLGIYGQTHHLIHKYTNYYVFNFTLPNC